MSISGITPVGYPANLYRWLMSQLGKPAIIGRSRRPGCRIARVRRLRGPSRLAVLGAAPASLASFVTLHHRSEPESLLGNFRGRQHLRFRLSRVVFDTVP